jgi:hypothetical protein
MSKLSNRQNQKRPMGGNHPGGRLWRLSGQPNTYLNSMDRGWGRGRPQQIKAQQETARPVDEAGGS